MNEKTFYTLEELCEYLRLSKETIYKLTKKKDFPKYKFGRLWRFEKSEIDAYLQRQKK